MSPDASTLLDRLTLKDAAKVRGSILGMEWLKRGYSMITVKFKGEDGTLKLMAVMIAIKSLKENKN
jgi:hypothetical protein